MLAGAAHGYFPIGMYGVDDPAVLPFLREAGFNAVQSYRETAAVERALLAAARRQGFRVLARPAGLMAEGRAVPDPRGVAGWYLVDEPDVSRIAPAAISARGEAVRRWAPGTVTALVVGDGRAATRYAGCADVVMVDWYPVPHLSLGSVGDHVRWTAEAAGGKPVWAVLQAFDWRDSPQRDPRKKRIGRFPTGVEIRCMTAQALIEGAHGIWYFMWQKPGGLTLRDLPEWWWPVAAAARDLRDLEPILDRGVAGPVRRWPEGGASRTWMYRGRAWTIAVNPGKRAVPVPGWMRRGRPVFTPPADPGFLEPGGVRVAVANE